MIEEALALYKECESFHLKLTKAAVDLESKVVACGAVKDQADASLVARETAKMMEHCAKQLRRLEYLSTQVCCALWASTPNASHRIKTEYCTASPSVTYKPVIPSYSKSHEKYVEAMRSLGVPEAAIESGCLQFHWGRLCEYVTSLVEQGLPCPPGINLADSAPKFTLNARSKGKLGRHESDALDSAESDDEESEDVDGFNGPF